MIFQRKSWKPVQKFNLNLTFFSLALFSLPLRHFSSSQNWSLTWYLFIWLLVLHLFFICLSYFFLSSLSLSLSLLLSPSSSLILYLHPLLLAILISTSFWYFFLPLEKSFEHSNCLSITTLWRDRKGKIPTRGRERERKWGRKKKNEKVREKAIKNSLFTRRADSFFSLKVWSILTNLSLAKRRKIVNVIHSVVWLTFRLLFLPTLSLSLLKNIFILFWFCPVSFLFMRTNSNPLSKNKWEESHIFSSFLHFVIFLIPKGSSSSFSLFFLPIFLCFSSLSFCVFSIHLSLPSFDDLSKWLMSNFVLGLKRIAIYTF